MRNSKLLMLIEIAIFAAIAIILDLFCKIALPLKYWPQGGSISIATIAVFIVAFRWGVKAGAASGLLFGILQLLTGEQYFSVFQAFLDYILAFSVLGLAGLFSKQVMLFRHQNDRRWISYAIVGIVFSSILRLICHIVSGFLFFKSYVPAGTPVWEYMITYNVGYMAPSILVTCIVFILLVKALPKKLY